jgi:hypothetical protein
MKRRDMDRQLQRLFALLEPVLTPAQLDDVTGFYGQAEWDLAIDLAARLVAERGAPISADLHDRLIELLDQTEYADRHDRAALAALRT